jgi:integrase
MPRKRQLPDGMKIRNGEYHCDFYAGGRRIRKRLSGDFKAACAILNDLKARADRADFGLLDNDVALDELREGFLRHARQTLKPKTVERYTVCFANLFRLLPVSRVHQIRMEVVRAYREERLAEEATPRTVNMEVIVLGTMLRWAVDEDKIGSNPIAGIKPLPDDHAKEGRALTDEEVRRLLDTSPARLRDIWYAFLVTGMRKDELASLTFQDIDWEAREVLVRRGVAKNHKQRRIPIDAGLWEILCCQRDAAADRQPGPGQTPAIAARVRARFSRDHVFVSKVNTPLDHASALWRSFQVCCKKAGIATKTFDTGGRVAEHIDLHSMRRTFATNLIASGADPKSVQELLGHATLDMTMKIYAKIHTQTKRQALSKLSYGQGAIAPDHILVYPTREEKQGPNGHPLVTETKNEEAV